jgi:hypothetical protein
MPTLHVIMHTWSGKIPFSGMPAASVFTQVCLAVLKSILNHFNLFSRAGLPSILPNMNLAVRRPGTAKHSSFLPISKVPNRLRKQINRA